MTNFIAYTLGDCYFIIIYYRSLLQSIAIRDHSYSKSVSLLISGIYVYSFLSCVAATLHLYSHSPPGKTS